jgi:hypothetical protein
MLVLLAAIILFGAFLLPFTVGRCAIPHCLAVIWIQCSQGVGLLRPGTCGGK